MSTPKPAARAPRRPRTPRPIATLLDLLGRRWALRILWELNGSPLPSRALAARCGGVSPTVLHRRLAELRKASVVDLEHNRGYALSPLGGLLLEALLPLEVWAERWVAEAHRSKRPGRTPVQRARAADG